MFSNRYVFHHLSCMQTIMETTLSSDLIQKIFTFLSLIEVPKICVISNRFNMVGNREALWRDKVQNCFGVDEKQAKTWKQTAIKMVKCNMINLNKKWVNGQTYREILDEALNEKLDKVEPNIQTKMLSMCTKYVARDNENDANDLMCVISPAHTVQEILKCSSYMLGIELTHAEAYAMTCINSREMQIVHNTYIQILVNSQGLSTEISGSMSENPIHYVMKYSPLSSDSLSKLPVPQMIGFDIKD